MKTPDSGLRSHKPMVTDLLLSSWFTIGVTLTSSLLYFSLAQTYKKKYTKLYFKNISFRNSILGWPTDTCTGQECFKWRAQHCSSHISIQYLLLCLVCMLKTVLLKTVLNTPFSRYYHSKIFTHTVFVSDFHTFSAEAPTPIPTLSNSFTLNLTGPFISSPPQNSLISRMI